MHGSDATNAVEVPAGNSARGAFAAAALAALPLCSAAAVDTDLRYRDVAVQRALGHDPDVPLGATADVIGRRVRDVVSAGRWLQLEPMLRTAMGGTAATDVLRSPIDPLAWHETTCTPITSHGEVIGCLVTVRDVTATVGMARELQRLQAVHDLVSAHTGDVVVLADLDGVMTQLSPSCARILGWTSEEMVGRRLADVALADDVAGLPPLLEELERGRGEVTREFRMRRPDGSTLWVEALVRGVRGPDGTVCALVATVRALDDRRLLLGRLERAVAVLETSFEASTSGMALVSTRGRCMQVNAALCAMTGRTANAVMDVPLWDLADGEGAAGLRQAVTDLGAGLGGDRWSDEVRVRRPDDVPCVLAVTLVAVEVPGAPRRLVLNAEDVTADRLERRRLQVEAETDPLTGLWNRRHLDGLLTDAGPERRGRGDVLMHIDIDGFKQVNDTYGHDVGDDHLREIAEVIREATREDDVVARVGGDEFIVVCRAVDVTTAGSIARRVIGLVDGLGLGTGASVGLARRCVTESASAWRRRADQAMYAAKRSGGRTVVVASNHDPLVDRAHGLRPPVDPAQDEALVPAPDLVHGPGPGPGS